MGLLSKLNIEGSMREFSLACQVILPIMKDPKEPREEKRKVLCMMVDQLSENTFNRGIIIKQIMTIINMKEDECKNFDDTKAQVDSIIGWLPRMSSKRKALEKNVGKHRKKYGLKL